MRKLPFFFLVCCALLSTGTFLGCKTTKKGSMVCVYDYDSSTQSYSTREEWVDGLELDPVLDPLHDPSVDPPPPSTEDSMFPFDMPVEIKGTLSLDVCEAPEGYMGKRIAVIRILTDEKTGTKYQIYPAGKGEPDFDFICKKCIAARRTVLVAGMKVSGPCSGAHVITDERIAVSRIRDEQRVFYNSCPNRTSKDSPDEQ